MATASSAFGTLILTVLFLYVCIRADFIDRAQIEGQARELDLELINFLKDQSALPQIETAYNNAKQLLEFESVDGKGMVNTMAQILGQIFEKKLRALEKSVARAEELAKEYTYNNSLEIGQVTYTNAQQVETDDPEFEYSAKFKQKVNFGESSVHIPVEIYEGSVPILNALQWTSALDDIWRKNYENDTDLLWQYFGSQEGIMRNYPAQKWLSEGVDLYDVRRRPWYTQGASSPKDMLILVDTSGSSFGQTLALMKQSVKSLLSTLGENDFVNVAQFSDTAHKAGCFDRFVQATNRNKQILSKYVDELTAKGMANYNVGLKFAFEQFQKHWNNSAPWEGAHCNPIIMFLTDGGSEMPEELFNIYNPDKKIRIFSYAVGPTASPIAAAKWIACQNRGYFSKIPAMGAIRSTVQNYMFALPDGIASTGDYPFHMSDPHPGLMEHVSVLARSKALSFDNSLQWSYLLHDPRGLGMMTTATLPVYQKSTAVGNQTILGVMGTDVTISELQQHAPSRKLGPNGYAFSVNNNGYIIFHPNLKAQRGWLKDPPNIDLLDIEVANEDKEKLRRNMVNNETESLQVSGWILSTDETHVDKGTREYFYTGIPFSNFSLGIVIPDYHKFSIKALKSSVSPADGVSLLTFNSSSAIVIADWEYCKGVEALANQTDIFDGLMEALSLGNATCGQLLQELFFHANVTQEMVSVWEGLDPTGVEARYIATDAGLTRVYPSSAAEKFSDVRDTWKAGYYKRAFDNEKLWLLSAHYNPGVETPDENATGPTVLAAHVVSMGAPENHKAAVAGVRLESSKLQAMIIKRIPLCARSHIICYLLDDGGYIMASSDEDDKFKIGMFLGAVDNFLAHYLFQGGIYEKEEMYDYQASCKVHETKVSAGHRSFLVPSVANMMYEVMTFNWWTTKFAWLYMNFNIYNWWYSGYDHAGFAHAAETKETGRNRSCIKLMTQYHFGDSLLMKETETDGNCTRIVGSAALPNTNLLLAVAERDCQAPSDLPKYNSIPEEIKSVDPLLDELNSTSKCNITMRYRTKPEACYDQDVREDDTDCGGTAIVTPSLMFLILASLAALWHPGRQC